MKKVKIGVVGCGGIVRTLHIPAIRALKDELELVAVCDVSKEKAQEVSRKYDVPFYTNAEEMLEKEKKIEIVDICTWAWNHHITGKLTAEMGRHIIIEKPMAITLPCADIIIEACKNNNVHYEIAENYPRMPMDKIITKVIREGIIGDIVAAYVTDPVNGFSLDIGVHRMSQLRMCVGDKVKDIVGTMQLTKFASGETIEEQNNNRAFGDPMALHWGKSIVSFKKNNTIGACECFPLLKEPPRWAPDYRRVVGTKGIIFDDLWPNVWPASPVGKISLYIEKEGKWTKIPIIRKTRQINGQKVLEKVVVGTKPEIVWENPFKECIFGDPYQEWKIEKYFSGDSFDDWLIAMAYGYRSIARAIIHDKKPEYGIQGRKDLEMCIASYESSLKGKIPIEFPVKSPTLYEQNIHKVFRDRFGYDPVEIR